MSVRVVVVDDVQALSFCLRHVAAAVTKHNLTSDIDDLVEAGKAVALHMCSIRCQRQCQQPPDCKWPISGKDEVTSETCSFIDATTTAAITNSKKNNVINVGTLHIRSDVCVIQNMI